MKKILTIAGWEFWEKVKRKTFLMSIVITPLIMLGLVYFSTVFSTDDREVPSPIGLLDTTGKYANELIFELRDFKLTNGYPAFTIYDLRRDPVPLEAQLKMSDIMISEKDIHGLLLLRETDSLRIEYRSGGIIDPEEFGKIELAIQKAITKVHAVMLGLSSTQIESIVYDSEIERIEIEIAGPANEKEYITTFLTGYFFILLLLIMILLSGGMFVRGIVEEKSNRIIEVILSSCTIDQLLAGKILGLSWLGLFQIIIWILIGGLIFGGDMNYLNLTANFWLQIVFFILGYVLYISIFVGIGSLANTEHEAQQLTSTLSIMLVIPILIAAQVLLYPDSVSALILSYFPLTTAAAMILRLNIIYPPVIEIIFTIILSILSIYFVIRLSSGIFKIGILSYGKKPGIKELVARLKKQKK